MDLAEPPRRPRAESIVPMINVVFLLLIFFLMTSHLAQPEPFDVAPPTAISEAEPESESTLYVDKTGRMSYEEVEGDAALALLRQNSIQTRVIQVRADEQIKAKTLALILQSLAEAGLTRVELIVVPK